MIKWYNKTIFIFAGLAIFIGSIYAGNTGKIAGVIVDKQTREPLAGANVIIEGTTLGTATDVNGFYFILQVPPGKYDLVASYIGYHSINIRNVIVTVDLTTRVEIELESEVIQGPTIEVFADQPLVQRDVTSTRRTTSRETINNTPGIENTDDVFKLQAGVFVDTAPQAIQIGEGFQLQVRDESVKNVHIRGGRGGEILFMVDGMPVTHPLYGGRSVLELNVVDVEEVELLTGAFSAEYGQAQSGVVNITTRSGGDIFEGGVEYKTDMFSILGDSYDMQYTSFYIGGPEYITRRLLPSLGLNLPGKFSFFISGNGNFTNTQHNNFRTREEIDIFGIKFDERQDNVGNLNAKLNWNISNALKFIISYHGSWKKWSSFEWLWKKVPDNTPNYAKSTQNLNFRLNHTLSNSTFYNINIGYLGVNLKGSIFGTHPYEYWTYYPDSASLANDLGYGYLEYKNTYGASRPYKVASNVEASSSDPSGFIDDRSYDSIWRDDLTGTYTLKADITSQLHPEHLIKAGFEMQYNDIQYVDIQDGGTKLSPYGQYLYQDRMELIIPPGPFPEFGMQRWVFDAFPLIGGIFIQDKFEKESLIINAGIRFDWFMPGETVFNNAYKRTWESATGLKADWDWIKHKLSPRFGISFPISERTVLFFSYGHFNQLPELQFFYRDPYTGGLTGNPHLDFEQTVLYEFGFTYQLANDWAIDMKSYAKDISGQIGTTRLLANLGISVDLHDNKGYARARGIEIELNKRYANFISGKLSYTAQWATGYSSSAFEDYIKSINDFPLPIRERPVSWDVRHQIILQATIASPPDQSINLFGFKLPDNWQLTILSRYASGQPYTPGTFDPAEQQKKENTVSALATMSTDIKLNKTFDLGVLDLSFYIDVFNIFKQKNIQIAYGFNPWTGQSYKYGDINPETIPLENHEYLSYWEMVRLRDPRQLAQLRYARLGMSIAW